MNHVCLPEDKAFLTRLSLSRLAEVLHQSVTRTAHASSMLAWYRKRELLNIDVMKQLKEDKSKLQAKMTQYVGHLDATKLQLQEEEGKSEEVH